MRVIYILKNNIPALLTLVLASLTLTSCGMYQQATYDDGIYETDNGQRETVEYTNTYNDNNNSGAYQNYFEQKSLEAEDRYGDIFTDVDSYSSQNDATPETDVNNIRYSESYTPWGETADDITINVYGGNGFGVWNNWGWNNWGWNGWGWNRWGWNGGWGWNNWGPWGWNNWGPWGWNNWGWGWNNWGYAGFYNPYWRSPYNGYYSYNRGRRNYANRALANRRADFYSRSTNRNSTRYSNSRATRRGNNRSVRSSNGNRSTRATRSTRSTRSTRATRSSNSSRVRSTRSNNSSRSYNRSRSSSPSRGTYSSGGGGGRSSGGGRSGGGRRGGRI